MTADNGNGMFRNERVRLTRAIDQSWGGRRVYIEAGRVGTVQRETRHLPFGRCYVVAFRTAGSDGTGYWSWAYVPVGDVESMEPSREGRP